MADHAARRSNAVARLLTTADLNERNTSERQISVSARHEAVLHDGRRVLLLDDRGWGASASPGLWARMSVQEVEETTRTVVGPDEPRPGSTQADARAEHYERLAGDLHGHGVEVSAAQLESLPHDVVLTERLLARLSPTSGHKE